MEKSFSSLEEMKKKLEELQSSLFTLQCKDRYDSNDYEIEARLSREIKDLIGLIKGCE